MWKFSLNLFQIILKMMKLIYYCIFFQFVQASHIDNYTLAKSNNSLIFATTLSVIIINPYAILNVINLYKLNSKVYNFILCRL